MKEELGWCLERISTNGGRGCITGDDNCRRQKILDGLLSMFLKKRITIQRGSIIQEKVQFPENLVVEKQISRPAVLVDVGLDCFVSGPGDEQDEVPESGTQGGEPTGDFCQILNGDSGGRDLAADEGDDGRKFPG